MVPKPIARTAASGVRVRTIVAEPVLFGGKRPRTGGRTGECCAVKHTCQRANQPACIRLHSVTAGSGIVCAHNLSRIIARPLCNKGIDTFNGVTDCSVLCKRFRRKITMLPAMIKQGFKCFYPEPEHTAERCNRHFVTGNGAIDAKFFHQGFCIVKVRSPAIRAKVHEVNSMCRERRAEDSQIRILFKLSKDVQHMGGVFADVLIADISKTCPYAAGLCLNCLFVMHKAGIIIVFKIRSEVTKKRRNVPAAVLNHQNGNAVDRKRSKRFFNLGLFLL